MIHYMYTVKGQSKSIVKYFIVPYFNSYGDLDTLTSQYKTISNYMAANRLFINADKTHLIVMGTKETSKRRKEVSLQAGQHVIVPTRTENLIGGQDLKWKEHVICSD